MSGLESAHATLTDGTEREGSGSHETDEELRNVCPLGTHQYRARWIRGAYGSEGWGFEYLRARRERSDVVLRSTVNSESCRVGGCTHAEASLNAHRGSSQVKSVAVPLVANLQLGMTGWTVLAIVVLLVIATTVAFVMLMFGDAGVDDRRFMRTAWWMLAGWLILLGGAAVYVSFLDF